jgi:hypothetical protein
MPAWRRLGRAALIVAAGTAALSLAGPFALRPFVDVAGAAGEAGEVSVAFVLDFGGPASDQVVGCVAVPASDNGYDALAAFASQEHLALPTYNSSGLLCSIDDVPATGCGQAVPGGYIYWSYFITQRDQWSYANTGAFATVTPDDVQGWRFQNPGADDPSAPPPRTPPAYHTLCPPVRAYPPVRSAPAPVAGQPETGPGPTDTTTTGVSLSAPAGSSKSTTTTTTTTTQPVPTTTSLPQTVIPPDPVTGVVAADRSSDGGGPGPDPLIVGGLLVAVLAIAAYARWRKRPRTP